MSSWLRQGAKGPSNRSHYALLRDVTTRYDSHIALTTKVSSDMNVNTIPQSPKSLAWNAIHEAANEGTDAELNAAYAAYDALCESEKSRGVA